jgi:myo-inositol-1(or 4)-monophosphatase
VSSGKGRLAAALKIAGEAADLALGYFGDASRLGVKMKGAQDWLTEADGAVERLLRQRISELFPGDGFLGEEGGGTNAERLWIVDPIDGTASFARGDLLWCISIGYLEGGVPRLGVIHAPMIGEVFAAEAGKGATRNGKPIRAASTADMRTATIEIGWSARKPTDLYLGLVRDCMTRGASVKRSASGALGMCWVAAGRTDAYLEHHINSWDVAAGYIIAREAGATVNHFFAPGGVERGNPILAATPGLAGELADLMTLDRASLLMT